MGYFFFDEIHKYRNWNQELKNLYDSYPDIKIVFSGSSSINLIKGICDLSRRGVIYKLAGISFREYLNFNGIVNFEPITLETIHKNKNDLEVQLGEIKKIRGYLLHMKTRSCL